MPKVTDDELYRLHKSGGGTYSYRDLADKFHLTYHQVRERLRTYRSRENLNNCREGERIETTSTGANQARASSTSTRIRTLDELLQATGADLETWRVLRWGAKAWEGYAKRERTSLEFDEGRITGHVDRGGIETETLWSVWADLVRREPVAVSPTIQPVQCGATFEWPAASTRPVRRDVVVCDAQIGYRRDDRDAGLTPIHDRRVLDLALQIAVGVGADAVRFLGDMLDMTEWTDKYAREPAFYQTTQPALMEWHWWLRQYRDALPDTEIEWMEGNHEERMRRMLIAHLPMAYELRGVGVDVPPALSLHSLLALDDLAVRWSGDYPDELEWLNDGLAICHGDTARSSPGATARAMVESKRASVVFGHIHRRESVSLSYATRHGTVEATAICPGCACYVDGRVPGSNSGDNWQQGIAVIDYDVDGNAGSVFAVPVTDGAAVFGGALYAARDSLALLRQDVPQWNWR